jgi:hypothetical protein
MLDQRSLRHAARTSTQCAVAFLVLVMALAWITNPSQFQQY